MIPTLDNTPSKTRRVQHGKGRNTGPCTEVCPHAAVEERAKLIVLSPTSAKQSSAKQSSDRSRCSTLLYA